MLRRIRASKSSSSFSTEEKNERKITLVSRSNSERTTILLPKDLDALAQIWREAQKRTPGIWRTIFSEILCSKPALRFPFGIAHSADLDTNPTFQDHCRRFGVFWTGVFGRILAEDSCWDPALEFRHLGQVHSRNRHVMFDAESWLLFKRVLLAEFCSGKKEEEGRVALGKLLMFVVHEMKAGFLEGVIQGRRGSKFHAHSSPGLLTALTVSDERMDIAADDEEKKDAPDS